MPRKKLFAANWKMNKSVQESVSFINNFKKSANKIKNKEIVICPPFTSLFEIKKLIKNSNIELGAQNMHQEEKGAFTGEISALMLKNICDYVILGHSERRQYFSENNELINKKIKTALKNNLKVILCIGETSQERKSNKTFAIIETQLKKCLYNINNNEIKNIIVAYEPIWAIGTGNNATPQQAEEVHLFIRNLLSKMYNENISSTIRIIYGGSVNANNIKDLMKMKNIDGALVGGASLDEKSFEEICQA